MVGEVALEGMEFYARHGYYEEERKIGNKYTVDIFMTLDMEEAVAEDKLEGTVNYEKIYEIVAEVMGVDASLLEHLAGKLVKKIRQNFSEVESVRVRISKHNPPIKGLCKKATVTLEG
ncbi:MAG: dihydroneopterin aldolase [Cytophagales bacterium]|nr:dihydroneopterin aldolase [Cytophagales bacterium]